MKLGDYHFLYNASAYFAARERFGAEERAKLEAYKAAADEAEKKDDQYLAEVARLQEAADSSEFVALLSAPTMVSYETLCWAVAELTTQGELWQRYMGHDPHELLTLDRVKVELQPYQIMEAKALVMNAIIRGIKPPQDEKTEIDEVLEALQKKTGSC